MAFNSFFDPTVDIGRDPSLRLNPRAIIDQSRGVRRNRDVLPDDFDPEIARLQAMLNEALRKRRRTGSSTEVVMPPSSPPTASSTLPALPATSSRSTALVPVPGTERIQDAIATIDQNPREATELINSAIHSGAAGVNNPQFLAAAANYANAAEAPAGLFGAFRKFANAAKLKGAELAGAAALFLTEYGEPIRNIAAALGGVGVLTNILQNRLKRKSKEKIAHEQMELEREKLRIEARKEEQQERKDMLKVLADRIQHKIDSLQARRGKLLDDQIDNSDTMTQKHAQEIMKMSKDLDIQIRALGNAQQNLLEYAIRWKDVDFETFSQQITIYFNQLMDKFEGMGEIRRRKRTTRKRR